MKKILNGKLYDTNTATEIYVVDAGEEYFDLYTTETLYQKKNGEYFLLRSGGTYYDAFINRGVILQPRLRFISPLTYEEVLVWSEAYMPVEKYCELFGEPEE